MPIIQRLTDDPGVFYDIVISKIGEPDEFIFPKIALWSFYSISLKTNKKYSTTLTIWGCLPKNQKDIILQLERENYKKQHIENIQTYSSSTFDFKNFNFDKWLQEEIEKVSIECEKNPNYKMEFKYFY